ARRCHDDHRAEAGKARPPASPEYQGRIRAMTTTTTDKEVSPQDVLDAAEATYRSTQDAVARAHGAASRQALDDAETAAAQAISAAITGEGDRATVDAARERVEKLRRDHEWAAVELQAA